MLRHRGHAARCCRENHFASQRSQTKYHRSRLDLPKRNAFIATISPYAIHEIAGVLCVSLDPRPTVVQKCSYLPKTPHHEPGNAILVGTNLNPVAVCRPKRSHLLENTARSRGFGLGTQYPNPRR